MRKTTLITTAVSLGLAVFAVQAKPPGKVPPTNDFTGNLAPTCSCDSTAGQCDVSWTDVNSLGPISGPVSYGADVERDAAWTEIVEGVEVDKTSSASVDLEDYACDGAACSATATLPAADYPDDAEVGVSAKVKAFYIGPDGLTPRNFLKDTVECTISPPPA